MDKPQFKSIRSPSLLQKGYVELVGLDPTRLGDDLPKGLIVVLAGGPVKRAVLSAGRDATRDRLVNDDALDSVLGRVLDVESNSCDADRLPLEPSNTLQGEDRVGPLIGECLVLQQRQITFSGAIQLSLTITYLPERLAMLSSAGAAMVRFDGR